MFKKINRNMQTKFEIIETSDYTVAVSEEVLRDVRPHKGKYHLENGTTINIFPTYLTDLLECQLIVGYTPKNNAPELDLPLLPEIVVEDDVENQKWYKDAISVLKDEHSIKMAKMCLKAGYNAATKVYSEEDLNSSVTIDGKKYTVGDKVWYGLNKDTPDEITFTEGYVCFGEFSAEIYICYGYYVGDEIGIQVSESGLTSEYEIIQSIKQPTPKWFVAEYKTEYTEDGLDYQSDELKTTVINGKTYLVGTYLYE